MATILAAVQLACVPAGDSTDTGPGNVQDSGQQNTADTGTGNTDTGTRDAGNQVTDTGAATDMGAVDTGSPADSGVADSGSPADAGCTPQCTNRECGDDSCGGSCGTCTDGTCDAVSGQCLMPSLCPPMGPFGTRQGDIMLNETFEDCEGNTVTLHDVCQARVSWAFILAGW